jgi:hypothetical protein
MKLVLLLILLISIETIICFKYQHHHIKNHYLITSLRVLVDKPSSMIEHNEFPTIISQFNEKLVVSIKKLLILLYDDKHIYARFAALETIARVPYFAYISCLHLQETLGTSI